MGHQHRLRQGSWKPGTATIWNHPEQLRRECDAPKLSWFIGSERWGQCLNVREREWLFCRSFRSNYSKLTFFLLGVDPDVFDEDDTVSNPNSFVVAAFGDLKPGQWVPFTVLFFCCQFVRKYQVYSQDRSRPRINSWILRPRQWWMELHNVCPRSRFSKFLFTQPFRTNARNEIGAPLGQSQVYSFNLDYWTPGVGIFIGTADNNTRINWTLDGTLQSKTAVKPSGSATGPGTSTSPTASGITSGAPPVSKFPIQVVASSIVLSLFLVLF